MLASLSGALSLLIAGVGLAIMPSVSAAAPLCGGPVTAPTKHIMIVMLENQPYTSVIGNSAAPFQNSLVGHCGFATSMYGATHTSAANYLALTGGTVAAKAYPGCGSVSSCSSSGPSLFSQLDAAGLRWKSYVESMPSPCYGNQAAPYKIGHNPAIFYTNLTDCGTYDIGVPDLTAKSGPLWTDLNGTMPALAFVTPNQRNDGDSTTNPAVADGWLSKFVSTIAASAAYQSGSLAVLVTYDEGTGSDSKAGENCTNSSLDLAGRQPSCHVPFFVLSPSASGTDNTFFDHYSVTRTVDDVFGLSPLAGAAASTSLVGHFGIGATLTPTPTPTPTPSPSPTPTPNAAFTAACSNLSCSFDASATTWPGSSISFYAWDFGDGSAPAVSPSATTAYAYQAAGDFMVTLTVTDPTGQTMSASQEVSPTAASPPTAVLSSACTDLACTFDGSGSSAPGSTITSYAWTFGDGSSGTGPSAAETYASAGMYPVTLTVTNALGGSASTTQTLAVGPASTPPTFIGQAATSAYSGTETVQVPSAVTAGAGLVLIASSSVNTPQSAPSGWTVIGTSGNGSNMYSTVWERVATATDTNSSVTVRFGTGLTKGTLMLLAYTGTSVGGPVATATALAGTNGFFATTPAVTVTGTSTGVISYWAARTSSATGWTVPASQTVRARASGSGGGYIVSTGTDTNTPVNAGIVGALGASLSPTSATYSGSVAWTIVLAPAP